MFCDQQVECFPSSCVGSFTYDVLINNKVQHTTATSKEGGKMTSNNTADEFDGDKSNELPKRKKSTISNLLRKVSNISQRGAPVRIEIPLSTNCKFKIIIRTTKPELTVGFVLVKMPGFVLCAGKTDEMFAEKISKDPKFWERCTFFPSVNLWYDSFCAFECTREAGRYITYLNGVFRCRKYDGTQQFKQEASFVFNTSKLLKTLPPRRRAQSSIEPPKKEELCTSTATRKLSLNGDIDYQRFHSNQLSVDKNKQGADALYSVSYNACVGCLNLNLYDKNTISSTIESVTPTINSIIDLDLPPIHHR